MRYVLRAFGIAQRPLAWTVLALSPLVLFGVVADVISTGNAKIATIIVTVAFMFDCIRSVMEVENEVGSEAQARE